MLVGKTRYLDPPPTQATVITSGGHPNQHSNQKKRNHMQRNNSRQAGEKSGQASGRCTRNGRGTSTLPHVAVIAHGGLPNQQSNQNLTREKKKVVKEYAQQQKDSHAAPRPLVARPRSPAPPLRRPKTDGIIAGQTDILTQQRKRQPHLPTSVNPPATIFSTHRRREKKSGWYSKLYDCQEASHPNPNLHASALKCQLAGLSHGAQRRARQPHDRSQDLLLRRRTAHEQAPVVHDDLQGPKKSHGRRIRKTQD